MSDANRWPQVLALVDVETSGVDPAKDRVLEVACALLHVRTGAMLDAWSALCHDEANEAEDVNGIPLAALAHGLERAKVLAALTRLVQRAQVWTSWNLAFDAAFLPDMGRPSFCSMDDVPWPKPCSSRGLTAVALAHGVGVVTAHRALADVMTMVALYGRVAERVELPDMLALAMRPKALFEVADRNFDADRNAKAKAAGFAWQPDAKAWRRRMCPEDVAKLAFQVREVA